MKRSLPVGEAETPDGSQKVLENGTQRFHHGPNADDEVQLVDTLLPKGTENDVVALDNEGDLNQQSSAAVSHATFSTIAQPAGSQITINSNPNNNDANNKGLGSIVEATTTTTTTPPSTTIDNTSINTANSDDSKPSSLTTSATTTIPPSTSTPSPFATSAFAAFATTNPFASVGATSSNTTANNNTTTATTTTTTTATTPATTNSFSSFASSNPFSAFGGSNNNATNATTSSTSAFSSFQTPQTTTFSAFGNNTSNNNNSSNDNALGKPTSIFGSVLGSTPATTTTSTAISASGASGFGNQAPISFSNIAPLSDLSNNTDGSTNDNGEDEEQAANYVDHNLSARLIKQDQKLGEEDEENLLTISARIFQLSWVEVTDATAVPTQATFSTTGSMAAKQEEEGEGGKGDKKTEGDDGNKDDNTTDKKVEQEIVPVKKEQKYVERGQCEVRINKNATTNSTRIISRHSTKGSLIMNENIYKKNTNVVALDSEKKLRFTTIAIDPETNAPQPATYLFFFKAVEDANKFVKVIQTAQDNMQK